ncbi:sugar ABC transporter substrate-binding protein [Actinocatenispora rupis]|uniref:Sugar ABC transporter substrate-binding protein n=1 Tax=Actinocatenispora rupis TaxID=519421 RepID=A0A8J3J125_9ACTN|nr:sugar ABC transporter substrate-binding protein [Actinocatenispora rupis]
MRVRALGALALAGALVAGLAGCGGGSDNGEVTLTYGIWAKDAGTQNLMKSLGAEFTKTHPNVHVKVQSTPFAQYFTKLQTAAGGGSAPDVFWMNGPNFKLYASNGMLQPLSSDTMNPGNYPSTLVKLYTYNGKRYGVPKDFDTIGLWYNKKMFDAAGVKYPDAKWTWSDMQAAAKKLTNKAKGQYGIAAAENDQQNFYNTILQAGGNVISADGKKSGYDDPKSVQGIKLWTDLIKNGYSPTYSEMSDTQPVQMFQSGKVAMFYDGSWDATTFNQAGLKDTIDVAPLPAGPAGKAVVLHGLSNAVYAKGQHTKQAEEFVKFLGSKKAADMTAKEGSVLPAYNGTQQQWVKSMPQWNLQVFIDQLAVTRPYPVSKNTAAWTKYQDEILGQAWDQKISAQQACTQLAQKMNEALAKEK